MMREAFGGIFWNENPLGRGNQAKNPALEVHQGRGAALP